MKTAIQQDAEFEIHAFWHIQPVKLLLQQRHVLVRRRLRFDVGSLSNRCRSAVVTSTRCVWVRLAL